MSADPLLHIGYYKTGTTWLQRRIFPNRGLGFMGIKPVPDVDEVFVTLNPFTFDREAAIARFRPTFARAADLNVVPVISQERLSGHPLHNADAMSIADRLLAAFPSGRVLIVIRAQPGAMLSNYKWLVRTTGTQSFAAFWRVGEGRTFAPRLERFEYHHLIAYYQQLFGKERVLVLPYEWLRHDPRGFVGKIATFVGKAVPPEVPRDADNVSITATLAVASRYANLGLQALGLLSVFEGPPSDRRIRRQRIDMLDRLTPRRPGVISRWIERRWLEMALEMGSSRFLDSNEITEELTGLDLRALGYPSR